MKTQFVWWAIARTRATVLLDFRVATSQCLCWLPCKLSPGRPQEKVDQLEKADIGTAVLWVPSYQPIRGTVGNVSVLSRR